MQTKKYRLRMNRIRPALIILLMLLFTFDMKLLLSNDIDNDKSHDALFYQIFGSPPPPPPKERIVTLFIKNVKSGKITVEKEDDGSLTFSPLPILQQLETVLKPEIFQKISLDLQNTASIDSAALSKYGIQTEINVNRFSISIDFPAEMRGPQRHKLVRNAKPKQDCIVPNDFSSYLNYRVRKNYNYKFRPWDVSNDPMSLNLNGAINMNAWVLESSGLYLSTGNGFKRLYTRLVKDDFKNQRRYIAGDLIFPTFGYQEAVKIGGIAVSKECYIKSNLSAYAITEYKFFLEQPSEVEVWANRRKITTLHLGEGTHDIRNIPFSQGANKVELLITDISGGKQKLSLDYVLDGQLLNNGQSKYTYNLGLISKTQRGDYRYSTNNPFVSLFYRRGFCKTWNVGGYLQADNKDYVMGLDLAKILPFAKCFFEGAVSHKKNMPIDYATKIILIPRQYTAFPSLGWQLDMEYLGKHFGRITNTKPYNMTRYNFSLTGRTLLGYGVGASLIGNYSKKRDRHDSYIFTGTFNKNFKNGFLADLVLKHNRIKGRRINNEAAIRLSYNIVFGNNHFSASKVTKKDLNVSWDYVHQPFLTDRVQYFAEATIGHHRNQYRAKTKYEGNRGSIDLAYKFTDDFSEYHASQKHNVDAIMQGGIVYVDGNFALSKQIKDSFILAKGYKNFLCKQVGINPSGNNRYQAISSRFFGGAVATNTTSNTTRSVAIVPIDKSNNVFLRKTQFHFTPSYKSGFMLYLGEDAIVYVVGKLIDATDQPLARQFLRATPLSKGNSPDINFFTDRLGRFQILGMKAGNSYRISTIGNDDIGSFQVIIPLDQKDVYEVGDVQLLSY